MCLLNKLVSRGIQEAISVLEGARKQSADAYRIGSTVQPVVDVNVGVLKKINKSSIAGNSNYTAIVPKDKVWMVDTLKYTVTTDGTVANRVPNPEILDSESVVCALFG